MAKRFTDSDKWKREWFSELSIQGKLAWFYLLDQCDHRGVWFRNFKLMSDQVGFPVTHDALIGWFGDKIKAFDEDKYFIPSFVEFQYGELKLENNAHKPIIKLLEKLAPKEVLKSPSLGAQDKDKDKDKDKENVFKRECEGDFKKAALEIYARYPRKKGKPDGIKRLIRDFKNGRTPAEANAALDRFINQLKSDKTEKEFIPYFSTWTSSWTECLDPEYGSVQDFSEKPKPIEEMDLSHLVFDKPEAS